MAMEGRKFSLLEQAQIEVIPYGSSLDPQVPQNSISFRVEPTALKSQFKHNLPHAHW